MSANSGRTSSRRRPAKAIVLAQLGRLPTLEEVTVESPGANEVLVRMVASGICHTDLNAVRDARACPVVLGHEGAGIIEEVGSNVTHIRPGEHVVINWQAKCGTCRRCACGRPDLCENILGTESPRVYWEGRAISVMLNAGTFCPLVVVPVSGAIPIRRDIPLHKAALLGCAVATGVGAVLYTAGVQPGEGVAVIGTGGVGLNVVQGARLAGASPIIAIDRIEERLRLAGEFGATHQINNRDRDMVKEVSDLTNGRGLEHVFEVAGAPDLMSQGIEMLCRGGTMILVGATARDEKLSFHPRRFMSQQKNIRGCIYGNIRPETDLPKFADWVQEGRLILDPLSGERVPLQAVPEIFARTAWHSGIRTIIEFDGAS
jgi:S-(hydroxymethyl)glutathione dehydrogenase / alcohol dehydrogenase